MLLLLISSFLFFEQVPEIVPPSSSTASSTSNSEIASSSSLPEESHQLPTSPAMSSSSHSDTSLIPSHFYIRDQEIYSNNEFDEETDWFEIVEWNQETESFKRFYNQLTKYYDQNFDDIPYEKLYEEQKKSEKLKDDENEESAIITNINGLYFHRNNITKELLEKDDNEEWFKIDNYDIFRYLMILEIEWDGDVLKKGEGVTDFIKVTQIENAGWLLFTLENSKVSGQSYFYVKIF